MFHVLNVYLYGVHTYRRCTPYPLWAPILKNRDKVHCTREDRPPLRKVEAGPTPPYGMLQVTEAREP